MATGLEKGGGNDVTEDIDEERDKARCRASKHAPLDDEIATPAPGDTPGLFRSIIVAVQPVWEAVVIARHQDNLAQARQRTGPAKFEDWHVQCIAVPF
nr:hypothetical protein CFP56_13409 [Quercus suber]